MWFLVICGIVIAAILTAINYQIIFFLVGIVGAGLILFITYAGIYEVQMFFEYWFPKFKEFMK